MRFLTRLENSNTNNKISSKTFDTVIILTFNLLIAVDDQLS